VPSRLLGLFARKTNGYNGRSEKRGGVFGALFLGLRETRAAFVGSVGIVRRFPSDREEDDA
jgi:hypothetical protein